MRAPIAIAALALALVAAAPAAAQTTGSGTVRPGSAVRVRATPGGAVLFKVKGGRTVPIACQTNGPTAVGGPAGRSGIWDSVTVGSRTGFISDSYVAASPTQALVAPYCDAPATRTATSGACRLTSPVPLVAPFTDHGAFIRATVPGAQASARETGVPASVTVAQAILESAWGAASAGANNFFGMKAQPLTPAGLFDWAGVARGCVLRKTQEDVGGKSETQIGAFRAYASLKDSIRDHGLRLRANPVYATAFAHTDDPKRFARIIAPHYATDPHYASEVIGIMRTYDLQQYDVKATKAGAPASDAGSDGGDGGGSGASSGGDGTGGAGSGGAAAG